MSQQGLRQQWFRDQASVSTGSYNEKNLIATVILAVSAAAIILFLAFAATAQNRDTTGAELLSLYSSSLNGQDAATMYAAGVIEGMWAAHAICPPQGTRRDVLADVVIMTLARTESLYGVSIATAVPRVAAMVYPCGDPA